METIADLFAKPVYVWLSLTVSAIFMVRIWLGIGNAWAAWAEGRAPFVLGLLMWPYGCYSSLRWVIAFWFLATAGAIAGQLGWVAIAGKIHAAVYAYPALVAALVATRVFNRNPFQILWSEVNHFFLLEFGPGGITACYEAHQTAVLAASNMGLSGPLAKVFGVTLGQAVKRTNSDPRSRDASVDDRAKIAWKHLRELSPVIPQFIGGWAMNPDLVLSHPDSITVSHAEREARARVLATPTDARAYLEFGRVLGQAEKADEGIETLERAIQLTDDPAILSDAHNYMGNVFSSVGKKEDAILHYREAIQLNPTNPHAHLNLAQELDFGEEALQEYKEVLRLEPDYAEAHAWLARRLIRANRESEALPHIDRYLELDPHGEYSRFFTAAAEQIRTPPISFEDGVDSEELERRRREILKNDPRHQEARIKLRYLNAAKEGESEQVDRAMQYYEEATMRYWDGQTGKAIELLEKALEHDPKFSSATFNLSCLYLELGNYEKAAFYGEKSIDLEPENWRALTHLAALYAEFLSKPERSLNLLEKALALWLDHPGAHFNLGITYEVMGQLERAVACFRRACELEPHNAKYRESLNRITETMGPSIDVQPPT